MPPDKQRKKPTGYILGPNENEVVIFRVEHWKFTVYYPLYADVGGELQGFTNDENNLLRAVTSTYPSQVLLYWSTKEYLEGPAWLDLLINGLGFLTLRFRASADWIIYAPR